MDDGAELGAEVQDVAAVDRVGRPLEGVLVHVGDAVDVVAAEDGRRPGGVARHPQAGHPRGGQRPPQVEDVEAGVEDLLGVVGDGLAQLVGDGVQRLVPGDRLPAGVDPDPPLGVGPAQRDGDPAGLGQPLEAGVALGAGPAGVVGVVGVADDLVHRLVVVDVGQYPAAVHADGAGAADPAFAVGGSRPGAQNCLHPAPLAGCSGTGNARASSATGHDGSAPAPGSGPRRRRKGPGLIGYRARRERIRERIGGRQR